MIIPPHRALLLLIGTLALHAASAFAQEEEKAQVVVTNFRNEPVTIKYVYVFRDYSWAFMTHELDANGEITYRRPANLPGCKQLVDWGIDKGRFVILANNAELCDEPMSICEVTNYTVEVHNVGCKWKKK
ncbi:MAG: hypothetical protein EXR11_05340 [Rhodospirillaceae bacterium]|nr:hypothetical protein [Rhodospirillaceae bacterium]